MDHSCVYSDPNGSQIVWPKMTAQGLNYLKMSGAGDRVQQGLRHQQCSFRANILPLLEQGTICCGGTAPASSSSTCNRVCSASM